MFRSVCFAAAVLCVVSPAHAATRLAVLDVESPALATVATFLELELLKLPDTEGLDRATIGEILKEQTLQRAFSADATADRVALGTMLKADVLVLVQTVDQPKRHALLMVFETKRGLRLQVRPFEITANAQDDATGILPDVKRALERARAEVREIVAVPPMVSNDLAIERQALGKPLATAVEQMLLARPGFAVVELAEARAIGDEAAITASGGVARNLPLYLNGEFRHDGFGADARITISLSLTRGTTVVGSHTIRDAAADEAAGLIRKEAAALLDAVSHTTAPPADPAAEAKQLAERARLMYRLSAWMECVELAEASLLLMPAQVDLHRLIVDAVKEKVYLDLHRGWDKESDAEAGRGFERYTMKQEPIDESVRRSNVALLHRALPHLEYFMVHSDLRYSDDLYRTIGGFFGLCKGLDEEPPAMMVRVMKAKKAAKRSDDTIAFWEYCAQSCFVDHSSAEKWQWKFAMAENWPTTDEKKVREKPRIRSGLTALIIHGTDRDDPFLPTALERLKAIDHPDVQQVAADIARRLEQGFQLFADIPVAAPQRPAAPGPTKPPEPTEDADVRFTMEGFITMDVGEALAGWMPAGPGIDAVWTDDWLFFFKDKVLLQPQGSVRIKYSPLGRCVRYDGRSVWAYRTTAEATPELIVVDPKNAHVETITTEHGLPPMPLTYASITVLREGSVCVVGHFDGRAWIGLASFDPETGARSLRVIHEALEQTVGKKGSAWKNTKTAFPWSRVYTLTGPPAEDGASPQRVVVERIESGSDHPLMIDPATHAVDVLDASTGWISDEAVQHEGAMYWAGTSPKGWRIHRLGFPSLKPEAYPTPIPERTRLFRAGSLIGLQFIHHATPPLDTVWLADDFGGVFRPFRTQRANGTEMTSATYFSSNAYGAVALRGRAWFRVHFKDSAEGDADR